MVPCTASEPMLPPGNSIGWTVKLSVVKTSSPAPASHGSTAASLFGVEQRVAEVTREDLVDQLAHVAPAVAVRKGNMGVQHRHERTSRPGRPMDSSGTRASSFQASSSARM